MRKTLLLGLWFLLLTVTSQTVAQSRFFVPQIVDGQDQFNTDFSFRTEFTILNAGTTSVEVTLMLRTNQGEPLERLIGGIAGDRDSEVSFELPSLGAGTVGTSGGPFTETGWAEISADGPVEVAVQIRYFRPATGENIASAGIGIAPPSQAIRTVARISPEAGSTGFAVLNPNGEQASLTLVLRRGDGTQEAQLQIDLPAQTKIVQFLNEGAFFSDLDAFQGTLEIESDQPISVIAIEVEELSWTTFPTFASQEQN